MRKKRDALQERPYSVVFDVGATSVGVGLSRTGSKGNKLLWYARLEYSYESYDDYHHYVRSMYSTLLELGMKLTSEGLPFARAQEPSFRAQYLSVNCVFSPPWFFGGVETSSKEASKPFTVDEALLEQLHRKGLKKLLETPTCVSWQEVVGDHMLLDQLDQSVYLQGYPITNWRHRPTRDVSVVAYYSIVGKEVFQQVTDILERVLPHAPATIHTSTHLLSDLYHQTLWGGETAHVILIEILGQITSVATVRKGGLTFVNTIPVGTNSILRAAAPNAVTMREAQSKLEVVRKTKEGGDAKDMTLPEPVKAAIEEWQDAVRSEIIEQSGGVTPPELAMVLVGNNWNDFLLPELERPFMVPGIREERPLIVRPCKDFVSPIHEGDDVPKDAIQESRIQVFTHALRPRLGA